MTEFKAKPRRSLVELKIGEQIYSIDVSPTSHPYVKQCLALHQEAVGILSQNIAGVDTLEQVVELYDSMVEKFRALVEILLPGKFDELFEVAGKDVLTMAELIGFVVTEVRAGAAKVRIEEAAPAARPSGEDV